MKAVVLLISALFQSAFLPSALAADFYSYIGQIESRSVLIAWGTTKGPNTIGRDSVSLGEATITMAGREQKTSRNWTVFSGLDPDRRYEYKVHVRDYDAAGHVRTFPEHATRLRFFLLGDYGNGTSGQREVAAAMTREFERLNPSENPVRFVLTTGDNIYSDLNIGIKATHSGENDADWDNKFYAPYSKILREIPFYPSPGNHDGNGSESRGDLAAYLDNFFFPGNRPARWYAFRFADLAEFFSLDTTLNSATGRPRPVFLPAGEQFAWFQKQIAESAAPWKIPYMHHPPFNAGPFHGASLKDLKHFCDSFVQNGVKVAFSGHEHNFQFTGQNAETSGIEYVISGAGGELRPGNVRGRMVRAGIAGWAPQRHFLEVEIDGSQMQIRPIGTKPVEPLDPNGNKIQMPVVVKLP